MKFSIRIAILGCESTGKSSVINALCGEKASQTNYGRCTAGVNVFRLYESNETAVDDEDETKKRTTMEADGPAEKRRRIVESTYNIIKDKNDRFKSGGGGTNTFDLPVNKLPITMRKDSQLVLVEASGLNVSQSTNQESRAYFRDEWESFDAAIVVMDAQEKADKQDQREILEFVFDLKKKKDVPVFILCNKIDDPDSLSDYPQEEHKLKAARSLVEQIWHAGCRERALEDLIKSIKSHECCKYESVLPVFLPVSAKTAFLLRAGGAAATKEEFGATMDSEDYHFVGLQEFGREWRSMSRDEKSDKVFEMLQNPKKREELLHMSGFGRFLMALEELLGGDKAQTAFIKANFKMELQKGDFGKGDFLSKLRSLDDKRQLLNEPPRLLTEKVWESYQKWKQPGIDALDKDRKPERLAFAAKKLIEYQKFCKDLGWELEESKIKEEMECLVQVLIATINNHANKWCYHTWEGEFGGTGQGWKHLSPIDWQNILDSFLLLVSEPCFSRRFGREIVILKKHLTRFNMFSFGCSEGCESFPCPDHETLSDRVKVALDHGNKKVTPIDKDSYSRLNTIHIPEDYTTSEKHFAHIGWLFCESMA